MLPPPCTCISWCGSFSHQGPVHFHLPKPRSCHGGVRVWGCSSLSHLAKPCSRHGAVLQKSFCRLTVWSAFQFDVSADGSGFGFNAGSVFSGGKNPTSLHDAAKLRKSWILWSKPQHPDFLGLVRVFSGASPRKLHPKLSFKHY